ncbi:NUDIX hydrolase [Candidatus Gottesmanbacteria bacterium]|nr:NUDIX hydrolase [Candidatus Gottesmanbacteria bacterium]
MTENPRIVTRAIITDENNRVLLGRRKKGIEAGKLSMFGGKVEKDESTEDGIRREVLEETGLMVIKTELLKIADSSTIPDEPWEVHTFRCSVTGEIKVKPDEHSEARYFSIKQIRNATDIAFDHKDLILELLANSNA